LHFYFVVSQVGICRQLNTGQLTTP
jgi:hypothetical protein